MTTTCTARTGTYTCQRTDAHNLHRSANQRHGTTYTATWTDTRPARVTVKYPN